MALQLKLAAENETNLLQGGGGEDERWQGVVCLAGGYLGGGGRPGRSQTSVVSSFDFHQEIVGVAAQQFRDFLHVFSATALQSLLVVLCGGPPDMVDTVRQSLEDLSQDVEDPRQYQTSLGFTVLHCRQGAEVFAPPEIPLKL